MRPRSIRRTALLLYLAMLHAALLILALKTNALPLIGKTLGWLPPEEWTEAWYRAVLEQAARARNDPPGRTVLLGDSMIAGLDAGRVAPEAVNFGLSGDTIPTLRARLPTLQTVATARRLVVGIGVNDLKYRAPLRVAADAAALLAALPAGVGVTLLSPLPVDEAAPAARGRPYLRNAGIRVVADGMRAACAARPGCAFVDAWPAIRRDAGGGGAPFGPDGWHLSAAGDAIVAGLLAAALAGDGR